MEGERGRGTVVEELEEERKLAAAVDREETV